MSPDNKDSLLPCPFCGSPAMDTPHETMFHTFRIICPHCDMGGPELMTRTEAIAAWNRRSIAAGAAAATEGVKDERIHLAVLAEREACANVALDMLRAREEAVAFVQHVASLAPRQSGENPLRMRCRTCRCAWNVGQSEFHHDNCLWKMARSSLLVEEGQAQHQAGSAHGE